MLEHELDSAFELIYRSFNRHGHHIARDDQRHPEHTRSLLVQSGNPDAESANILVTGSKGKGSAAFYTQRLLRTQGGDVGLFTSPHLLDSLERIRINERMVSEEAFVDVFHALEPHLRDIVDHLPPGQYVGPVGIFAAMAARHFKDRVRWAVYETGRGALYDDVAQIQHHAAVITTILLEHVKELGPGLTDIARHKAGAISPQTRLVVLGSESPVLSQAVADRCRQLGTSPRIVRAADFVRIERPIADPHGTRFDVLFDDGRVWRGVGVPSVGSIVANIGAAIAVVEHISGPLSESAVRTELATAAWPGRGEILSQTPFILLDAGVRPESVLALLEELGPFDDVLMSIPEGKDQTGMAKILSRHAKRVTATGCSNPRLSYRFDSLPLLNNLFVEEDVNQALRRVLADSSPSRRVFLCGTISFVADVYRHLGRHPLS